MDKPLHRLTLTEVLQGIADRRFTSESYTQALLARIASFDEEIRAWAWLKPEEAIAAARRCDGRLPSDGATAPLRGLPIGVKDIFATAGIPHGNGLPRLSPAISRRDRPGWLSVSRPKGLCHRGNRDHRMRLLLPRQDAQPLECHPYPRRIVERLRRRGRGGFCPGRPGHANQRFRHPARRLLRGCRLQTDPRAHSDRGRPDVQPHPGSAGHLHPLRGGCRFPRGLAGRRRRAPSPAVSVRPRLPRLAAVKTPVWEQAEDHARRNFREAIQTLRKGGADVDECRAARDIQPRPPGDQNPHGGRGGLQSGALHLHQTSLLSPTLKDLLDEGRATGAVDYARALKTRLELQDELVRFLSRTTPSSRRPRRAKRRRPWTTRAAPPSVPSGASAAHRRSRFRRDSVPTACHSDSRSSDRREKMTRRCPPPIGVKGCFPSPPGRRSHESLPPSDETKS